MTNVLEIIAIKVVTIQFRQLFAIPEVSDEGLRMELEIVSVKSFRVSFINDVIIYEGENLWFILMINIEYFIKLPFVFEAERPGIFVDVINEWLFEAVLKLCQPWTKVFNVFNSQKV